MNDGNRIHRAQGETDAERLRGLVAPNALSVDLVSVFAGDREPTGEEKELIEKLKKSRGNLFYSDLLYSMTHLYVPPEDAAKRWNEILLHKIEMSRALNRHVRIIVATLDYLSTLKEGISLPTLVGEAHIAGIVNLSMRDGLTGLFNHTTCFELLEVEMRSCARYGTIVSFAIADIDDFKEINDKFGHQEGDQALIQLAEAFKRATRESDVCCRYGGEEFAVILPLTHIHAAREIAERIRTEAMTIRPKGHWMTLSIGVASYDSGMTTSFSLVEKADAALYRAKNGGKNRVEVA